MMNLKFYPLSIVAGIVFGIVIVLVFKQQKVVVVDFPKPFDTTKHKDKNGICFQYITKEVNCNENEKTLKQYPIQA